MSWRDLAACVGADPDLFFPDIGEQVPGWKSVAYRRREEALAYCAVCPVRDPCLADALDHDDMFGVRGGLPASARQALRTGIRHGTVAGYFAERRLGAESCDDCRTAKAEDARKRRQRKAAA